jgi:uncharacterized membrane protein YozB (DUF420 family)
MPRGLLGTRATLVADINLILQIIVLIVLIVSTLQARRRGLSTRRTLTMIAVMLNAFLIVAIMNPSFFRILPFALRNPGAPVPTWLWPHVVLGASAELIGVYLIVSSNLDWDSSTSGGPVRRRMRNLARFMLLLWALALAVGLVIYRTLYA